MEERIRQLEAKIQEMERFLLKLPLDPVALGALREALIGGDLEQLSVRRLIIRNNGAVNPAKEGEIVYHSTTPSLKVLLNGTVRTINVT